MSVTVPRSMPPCINSSSRAMPHGIGSGVKAWWCASGSSRGYARMPRSVIRMAPRPSWKPEPRYLLTLRVRPCSVFATVMIPSQRNCRASAGVAVLFEGVGLLVELLRVAGEVAELREGVHKRPLRFLLLDQLGDFLRDRLPLHVSR